MTFSYKDNFLNFYYFYCNELLEDNKYRLTTDLIKNEKDLLNNLGNIFGNF